MNSSLLQFTRNKIPTTRVLIDRTLVVIAFAFIAALTWQHWSMIGAPFLLEYREGSVLTVGQHILGGLNPFTLESLPENTYVYGFIYPYLGAPVAWLFGDLLLGYRLTSALFIFLCSALILIALRREKIPWGLALIGAAIFHAYQLQWLVYTARCDSLGLFFFLVAIYWPYWRGWSYRSLAVSSVLCIAAFYTKPYFLYSLAVVGLFVLLFQSKKKAMFFGSALIVVASASAIVVNLIFPTFFLANIFLHTNYAIENFGHLVWQLEVFTQKMWPLLVALLSGLLWWGYWRLRNGLRFRIRPFRRFDEPVFKPEMNFHLFGFLMGFAVIVLVLGKHGGNFMIYLYQFMLPFLITASFTVRFPHREKLYLGYVLPFVALVSLLFGWKTARDQFFVTPVQIGGEADVVRLISEAERVYSTPVFVPQLIEQEKKVWDNGLTQYFKKHSYPEFLSGVLPPLSETEGRWSEYQMDLSNKVKNQYFDLIVLNGNFGDVVDRDSVEENYELLRTTHYRVPEQNILLEFWIPGRESPSVE